MRCTSRVKRDVADFVKPMKKSKLTVVKIGGNVIDNSAKMHQFLIDFTALPGAKILVHGGGKAATEFGISMGIEPKMVNGRRVTDIETLRLVTMVYAGLINKNIVAQLQAKECNAIGLTGADGNIIRAHKRTAENSRSLSENHEAVDYGFVGDLNDDAVSADAIEKLLNAGFMPVFCAITHDGDTQLLNTNADTIASAVAVAMSAHYETTLVYCFEKKGVMRDIDNDNSVIQTITPVVFEELKRENIVSSGMLPKLQNAFAAVNSGVHEVFIGKSDDLGTLPAGNFGTKITN